MKRNYRNALVSLVLFAAILATVPGCNEQWRESDAVAAQAKIEQRIADDKLIIAATSSTDSEKKAAAIEQASYEAMLASLKKIRSEADAAAPKIEQANGVLSAVSVFVPPPYGSLVSMIGGGIVGWIARRKPAKALAQLVAGLDVAKMKDPTLAAALANNAATLKANQDFDVQTLIDKLRA